MRRGGWFAILLLAVGVTTAPAQGQKVPQGKPSGGRESRVNEIGMKLNRIPAGSFRMGAPDGEADALRGERPQHKVTISRPFELGVHEVTQEEYRKVMGANPSHWTGEESLPVEKVSWFDAIRFCNALSKLAKRDPYYRIDGETVTILGGAGYRLPTEAEWEYACRAGTSTRHPAGDSDADLASQAWVGQLNGRTHPVGQKTPNAWGLYDMQGNVAEWCFDLYGEDYYATSRKSDPRGPSQPPLAVSERVYRGGSWRSLPKLARPAVRYRDNPGNSSFTVGFRVAADKG